jgi:hypothetical protein
MLSYSESTALGYEPESRKWGANGTLVEHWQSANEASECRNGLGHNVAR